MQVKTALKRIFFYSIAGRLSESMNEVSSDCCGEPDCALQTLRVAKKLCHLIPNATVRVDYLWALSRRQETNIIAVATSITSREMPIETAMPTVTETVRPPAAVVQ